MPAPRTALEHLIDGREALAQEVRRLTAALEELDAVIGRVSTGSRLGEPPSAPAVVGPADGSVPAEPARRAAAGNAVRRTSSRATANRGRAGGKSIRVHVLDMLSAEDREFGLSEIIDRIHRAGIPAHDDAVRSITTKLMKDGKVERIGRGQYRLARSAAVAAPTDPAEATAVDASPAGEPIPRPTPPLNLSQPWDGSAV